MYAFFRARTLGYDVYPEDYFLRNFPWQQYGGLWIVNEARFARAEPVNALTAQALRRITGVGASSQSNDSGSPTSFFANSAFGHQPLTPADPQNNTCSQYSAIPALDGSMSSLIVGSDHGNNPPMFNMGGLRASLPQPETNRPNLTVLTDVSRRYPGFPTPLSPTLSAKQLYPTPTSYAGSRASTFQPQSPAVRSVSPMSLDGSNMCGPSTRCMSHSYQHFAEQMGNIDNIIARNSSRNQVRPSSRAPSVASLSPTSPMSPQRALSPRVGMLRNMATKQALRDMHGPAISPVPGPQRSPSARNVRRDSVLSYNSSASIFCSQSVQSFSSRPIDSQVAPSLPSIQIANGTEFETGSPISPTGTMLSYMSNRAIDSGLLAVPALSEPQVAEYRFWVPCGRRVCAFGCGGAHEGENAAAKKLFREESAVEEQVKEEGYGFGGEEDSFEEVPSAVAKEETWCNCGSNSFTRPAHEWKKFLMNKERDVSVAKV